jgi:hypothetical protein
MRSLESNMNKSEAWKNGSSTCEKPVPVFSQTDLCIPVFIDKYLQQILG